MNKLFYLLIAVLLVAGGCKRNPDHIRRPLAVTGIFPASGLAHTLVTIYGAGFGADSTQNNVDFNGVRARVLQVTDTSLVVMAPDGGTTGSVSVKVGSSSVNAGNYTYQLLSVHAVSPLNGPAGTNVVIRGVGLSGVKGAAGVRFNGRDAVVVSSNDSILVAAVPDSAGTGVIAVTVDGSTATGPVFTYQAISYLYPLTGGSGTTASIHGIGFGTDKTLLQAAFNGAVASIVSIVDTMVVVKVSDGVKTGPVSVTINGQKTPGPVFTVVAAPVVGSMVPSSGLQGAVVKIKGNNFSSAIDQNQVDFNGTAGTITAASATELTVTVPAGVSTGHVNISVNGQQTEGPVFTVQALNITGISPDNGLEGTPVIIAGNGFDVNSANNQVFFNGVAATVTAATANQLTVTAPVGFTTGKVTTSVGGLNADGPVFSRAGVKTIYADASLRFIGLAVSPAGDVYVTARNNSSSANLNAVLKVSADGSGLTVLAGSLSGQSGYADLDGTAALFNRPGIISCDQQGNIYVSDDGNGALRKVTPSGSVSTVTKSLVASISGMGFAPNGDVYFSTFDFSGNSGIYVAKNGSYSQGYSYNPNNQRPQASTMAVDGAGVIYWIDYFSNNELSAYTTGNVRKLFLTNLPYSSNFLTQDPATGNVIMAGGDKAFYSIDQTTGVVSMLFQAKSTFTNPPLDGSLRDAQFIGCMQVGMDRNGSIYVIDGGFQSAYYIRKIFFH